ncbi:MAG: hypothetical protein R3B72_48505 [Polyangiaceae bacterium]
MGDRYAVMQHEAGLLPVTTLQDAFAEAEGLVAADARASHEVVADGLPRASADSLARALRERGVSVEVVRQRWLELPAATPCRRASVGAAGLVLYDLYGRSREVPWSQVLMVAGGVVRRGRVERVKDSQVVFSQDGVEIEDAEYGYREDDVITVDIVVSDPLRRHRIESTRFDYSYLGDRKCENSQKNLSLVLKDIATRAPELALGRGVIPMMTSLRKTERYRHERQLDQEVAWLLWRHHGPGRAIDGAIDFRREPFVADPLTAAESFNQNARAAAADRVMRETSVDRERYLARTKNLDVALGAVVGVLVAAWVLAEGGLVAGGNPVLSLLVGGIVWLGGGAAGFFALRRYRERSFWVDGG